MSLTSADFDDVDLDTTSGVDRDGQCDRPLAPVTRLHPDRDVRDETITRAANEWSEPDPRDRALSFTGQVPWSCDESNGNDRHDDEWGADDPDDADDGWHDDADDDPDDAEVEWDDEWGAGDPDDPDDAEVEWHDDADVEWDVEWHDDTDDEWHDRRPGFVARAPRWLVVAAGVGVLLATSLLVVGSGSPWGGGPDAVQDDPTPSALRTGPERRGGRVVSAAGGDVATTSPDTSAGAPEQTTGSGTAAPATPTSQETPATPAVSSDEPATPPPAAETIDGSTDGVIDGRGASDARPLPVQAVFAPGLITLSGALPSEAAADHLEALARANSTSPGALVNRFVTIDPTLPTDIDVRVIELDSVRFGDGSDVVTEDHARELDRVAAVLDALPHVDVLVIGHSDQRGDEDVNYELSVGRAQSVVDHLVSRGVEPSRLAARAVGEADLLSLDDDEAALALNRRTEFVFSGIFADVEAD